MNEAPTLPPTDPATARTQGIPALSTAVPGSIHVPGYEIFGELGRGGMGVVYKARQIAAGRLVALKLHLGGNLASEVDMARFRAEAEAAAGLEHPCIVPVYEVDTLAGQPFFSMKLVEGGSLADRMNQLCGDRRAAVTLLARVARAVHFAHQRGIIHRDLKPGNILLDADETPMVADFGLAQRTTGDARLTQTGAILGTPAYMAPEQARGERGLTTAADTYSLGAILYELLTGRPPFQAKTALDTILLLLEGNPPSPRSLDPEIDRDLEAICLKCLCKVPGERYASAEALADDLDRWLRSEPTTARPLSAWQMTWLWLQRNFAAVGWTAVIGLGCGLLGSLVVWCSDILPRLHQTNFAYDQLPGVKRPWLLSVPPPPEWVQFVVMILAAGSMGAAGMLLAALAKTRSRPADLAAGLSAGLLMVLGCFLFGGVWAYLISAVVVPTSEDRWLLTQASWNAGEHPGWPAVERMMQKYPDLLKLPPGQRVPVMMAKIEAETIIALGDGLAFFTMLMIVFAAPFLAWTTAAAGTLLRGRGRLLRAIVPYCEVTIPSAMVLFLVLVLLAKVHLGEDLGPFPLFFLCIVPIVPAVIGALRGWHWAVRLVLQTAWLAWFVGMAMRAMGTA